MGKVYTPRGKIELARDYYYRDNRKYIDTSNKDVVEFRETNEPLERPRPIDFRARACQAPDPDTTSVPDHVLETDWRSWFI